MGLHPLLVLVRVEPRAGVEYDHVVPRCGEFRSDQRAGGPGTDDANVGVP
jgi:hypothetical protein